MNELDISTILASAIHESKNRIGTLLYHTHTIKNHKEMDTDIDQTVDTIENILKQLNDEWVEYLYLYKLSTNGYNIQYETLNVSEFLDDQVFVLSSTAISKNLTLDFRCKDGLFATFDERLITSAISTTIYNSFRFAKKTITITAEMHENFLVFSIEDDGPGFENDEHDDFLFSQNTGLGLYFCDLSAQSHIINDTSGYITKGKSDLLNGACLKIFLPQ
ncbi:HAMP domain-containing sensor histidine kinase [Marinomonas sp. 15G1-11]|uniref:histidine kinase n=1 Tax=Marinomonas phaeophyticola TaxID=3004091 RepID=A0ABT4JQN5_9GAMM|nr:HAMP domain-containing sensor histidine kinase [Marinomonas sp. 15G1-11]MCZ2720476.1 HAMP domain-containing sensor histidine kinase [Marinomonas sp. 15G1-11]